MHQRRDNGASHGMARSFRPRLLRRVGDARREIALTRCFGLAETFQWPRQSSGRRGNVIGGEERKMTYDQWKCTDPNDCSYCDDEPECDHDDYDIDILT